MSAKGCCKDRMMKHNRSSVNERYRDNLTSADHLGGFSSKWGQEKGHMREGVSWTCFTSSRRKESAPSRYISGEKKSNKQVMIFIIYSPQNF